MQSSNRKLYRRLGFQLMPWVGVPENLRSCPLLFLEFLCRHRKPGVGHDSPLLSVRFLVGVGVFSHVFLTCLLAPGHLLVLVHHLPGGRSHIGLKCPQETRVYR